MRERRINRSYDALWVRFVASESTLRDELGGSRKYAIVPSALSAL